MDPRNHFCLYRFKHYCYYYSYSIASCRFCALFLCTCTHPQAEHQHQPQPRLTTELFPVACSLSPPPRPPLLVASPFLFIQMYFLFIWKYDSSAAPRLGRPSAVVPIRRSDGECRRTDMPPLSLLSHQPERQSFAGTKGGERYIASHRPSK